MRRRKNSCAGLRIFRAISALALLCSCVYMLIVGFSLVASATIVLAVSSVAIPIIASGGSALDMVLEFFSAIIEGFLALIEAISDVFSSLFN